MVRPALVVRAFVRGDHRGELGGGETGRSGARSVSVSLVIGVSQSLISQLDRSFVPAAVGLHGFGELPKSPSRDFREIAAVFFLENFRHVGCMYKNTTSHQLPIRR